MVNPAWIIVGFAILLIGVAKSGFGGGLGLIVVPITTLALPYTHRYGADDALGLLLPLLLVGDCLAVAQYRRDVCWQVLRKLLPGALIGIGLGTFLIWILKRHVGVAAALIDMEIGFESVLLVSIAWYRQIFGRPHRLLPEPVRGFATGTFAGTSTTLAHAAGPMIAMYLAPLNLGRSRMVATAAMFFLLANTAKFPTYWQAGLFDKISPAFALMFCPLVVIGAMLGRWLCRRMSDKLFVQIVYATVFCLGIFLVVKSGAELARR